MSRVDYTGMTGNAARTWRYRNTPEGRMAKRLAQARRRARLKDATVYKISDKSSRRDKQRLVETIAGDPQAMERRRKAKEVAAKKAAEGKSTIPSRRTKIPETKSVLKTATIGHQQPLHLGGSHSEGNVYWQTAGANYGPGGQGSKTIRQWAEHVAGVGLMPHPARPTELTSIKGINILSKFRLP